MHSTIDLLLVMHLVDYPEHVTGFGDSLGNRPTQNAENAEKCWEINEKMQKSTQKQ